MRPRLFPGESLNDFDPTRLSAEVSRLPNEAESRELITGGVAVPRDFDLLERSYYDAMPVARLSAYER